MSGFTIEELEDALECEREAVVDLMDENEALKKELNQALSNRHLPPRSDERLAWIRAREHCAQCLVAPVEEDRRTWASPMCHACMPPRKDEP